MKRIIITIAFILTILALGACVNTKNNPYYTNVGPDLSDCSSFFSGDNIIINLQVNEPKIIKNSNQFWINFFSDYETNKFRFSYLKYIENGNTIGEIGREKTGGKTLTISLYNYNQGITFIDTSNVVIRHRFSDFKGPIGNLFSFKTKEKWLYHYVYFSLVLTLETESKEIYKNKKDAGKLVPLSMNIEEYASQKPDLIESYIKSYQIREHLIPEFFNSLLNLYKNISKQQKTNEQEELE